MINIHNLKIEHVYTFSYFQVLPFMHISNLERIVAIDFMLLECLATLQEQNKSSKRNTMAIKELCQQELCSFTASSKAKTLQVIQVLNNTHRSISTKCTLQFSHA